VEISSYDPRSEYAGRLEARRAWAEREQRRHIQVGNARLALFLIAIVINVGMWLERFMIIVTSLHRDFMPSAWGMFYPTFWDLATLAGSIGAFALLFLLFLRFLPAISISEMRKLELKKQEGEV